MKDSLDIIIESKALGSDEPGTNLICKTLDGRFHRVSPFPASVINNIPEGWEKTTAQKTIIQGREKIILLEIKK